VFLVFTIIVIAFQYNREKSYKTGLLENTLENVTETVYNYIEHYRLMASGDFAMADTLKHVIPQKNIRFTLIDKKGVVLYDSFVPEYAEMENHFDRPEIQKALYNETGSNIRHSATLDKDFYYYARNYEKYFVRTAMVYDVRVDNFLKANRFFIFFIFFVFVVIWYVVSLLTKKLTESIIQLKDFSIKAGNNTLHAEDAWNFPKNELGDIGKQIVTFYQQLNKTKDKLAMERERLFSHMNILNEGIGFFKPGKEKMLVNSHFIQYINLISDRIAINIGNIFEIPEFKGLNSFLDEVLASKRVYQSNDPPKYECVIHKDTKYFNILCIVNSDKTFEVLITNITRLEKRRMLKQQLTSNITHELKTPLSSIIAYIETIKDKEIAPEKKESFIERAYMQAIRLKMLLNDISLLNNIEDAGDLFEFKPVKINKVVTDVIENLQHRLSEKKIRSAVDIADKVEVKGNESLLSSVFQNLIENSILYAGEGIMIEVLHYMEDKKFHYFKYTDTGIGISNEHLQRIFERFYRIDAGRSRESGGTGLGLAIVKNAVQFHNGEISARTKPGGGIEFLFTIAKG